MGRYGDLDYPRLAKLSTLLSLALVVVSFAAIEVGLRVFGGLSGWEVSLLTDLEFLGVAGALLCPFVFGVFLPLTE